MVRRREGRINEEIGQEEDDAQAHPSAAGPRLRKTLGAEFAWLASIEAGV